ncbi:phytolongin Phyl2.2 [Macadamia integrifolia]|uniref:phytolongin Phyl2.2 n=1 Tax=Macadamia integrifolia TaxID=60698 RepID=UPI001C4E79CE|nr:phytolongin Phyl2.2 [Macadamia integrifolia]
MTCNPDLILYACVSKGTTVLAEFSSDDKEVETLALQCIEKTPNLHAMFSHNCGKKIYTFLMEDPFVYFAIYDPKLGKSQGLGFLKRLKEAFMKFFRKTEPLKSLDEIPNYHFQAKFTPIFHELLNYSGELNILPPPPPPPEIIYRDRRNVSVDSKSGKLVVSIPLLEKPPSKNSKKKKKNKKRDSDEMETNSRDIPIEKMVNVVEDGKEFSVLSQKNGLHQGSLIRQQAQKKWWRYVGIALLIDIVICTALFGVWLLICRGFKCIRE